MPQARTTHTWRCLGASKRKSRHYRNVPSESPWWCEIKEPTSHRENKQVDAWQLRPLIQDALEYSDDATLLVGMGAREQLCYRIGNYVREQP